MKIKNKDTMTVEFHNLGIQCVKRKDISKSPKQRNEIQVDPYRQGFKHIEKPQAIDLNAVKLCFQVLLHPVFALKSSVVHVVHQSAVYHVTRVHEHLNLKDKKCSNIYLLIIFL